MTFGQKLFVGWVLASGVAGRITSRTSAAPRIGSATQPRAVIPIALSLVALTLALIMVGVVSHTLMSHTIQIVPVALALVALQVRPEAGVIAAGSVSAFWLLMMGAIWLFLAGVARIFTGTFSRTEVGLTIIIALASVLAML